MKKALKCVKLTIDLARFEEPLMLRWGGANGYPAWIGFGVHVLMVKAHDTALYVWALEFEHERKLEDLFPSARSCKHL